MKGIIPTCIIKNGSDWFEYKDLICNVMKSNVKNTLVQRWQKYVYDCVGTNYKIIKITNLSSIYICIIHIILILHYHHNIIYIIIIISNVKNLKNYLCFEVNLKKKGNILSKFFHKLLVEIS